MFDRVKSILQSYSCADAEKIVPEANLIKDLGFNSLDIINVVVSFEDEFGVDISNDDLRGFQFVSDITDYLSKNATK